MSKLDPRIHEVLDGDLPPERLPPELRAVVLRLERAAGLLRAGLAPASVAGRVLAALHRPEPSRGRRVLQWLTERHVITIAMRPVWSLALAAVLAAVVLVPDHGSAPLLGAQEGIARFVGHFPGARSVDVVGPFTDWHTGVVSPPAPTSTCSSWTGSAGWSIRSPAATSATASAARTRC